VVLFGITAFIAVASLFPGAGHRTFWEWTERLIVALTLNVWYSLVLSLVLLISRGMTKAGPEYGWKLTFFILAMFWWLMFVLRKRATRFVLGSLPGNKGHGQNHRTWGDVARDWHYKSKMLLPAAAGVGAGAGAVLHGTEKHSDRSLAGLARNARAGAHEAKDGATQAASKGYTTRLGDQAAINAMALDELEAEHKGKVDRHGSELQNRAERKSLEARQRAATNSAIPTDVLASMELPSSALSPAEERKLQRLQHAAMPDEEFEALGRTIGDVDPGARTAHPGARRGFLRGPRWTRPAVLLGVPSPLRRRRSPARPARRRASAASSSPGPGPDRWWQRRPGSRAAAASLADAPAQPPTR
jgi:hypothetical protein